MSDIKRLNIHTNTYIYIYVYLFNVPDYRNEELLPNRKVPYSRLQNKSEEASPVLYIM